MAHGGRRVHTLNEIAGKSSKAASGDCGKWSFASCASQSLELCVMKVRAFGGVAPLGCSVICTIQRRGVTCLTECVMHSWHMQESYFVIRAVAPWHR